MQHNIHFITANRLRPSTPSRVWTPLDMTTTGWWDFGGVASGSISQVDDKDGTQHLSQSTGGDQPESGVRTINGLNVGDFDGSEWMESISHPIDASGDVSIYVVAEIDNINNSSDSIFSLKGSSNDFQFEANNGSQFNGRLRASGIGSNVNLTGGSFEGTSIYNTNFDFSGTGVYNVFIDGIKRGADTTYNTKLDTPANFLLATNRNESNSVNCGVAEVIITTDKSDLNRLRIEGWLAHKHGTQGNLPNDHPYKNKVPMIRINN